MRGSRASSSPDICLKIADAKVKEWAQARVLRERTDTFSDGTTRKSEFIFTENGLYFRIRDLWQTGQVTWAQAPRRRCTIGRAAHGAFRLRHRRGFPRKTGNR